MSAFPQERKRRLRQTPALRRMVRENRLHPSQFIQPFFVTHGSQVRKAIPSMPGCDQVSIDQLLKDAASLKDVGIVSVLLFGLPKKKDAKGSEAWAKDGIVQQAVRALKKHHPDLIVITDLCFCEYTTHGHCGVLRTTAGGGVDVDNDATLPFLERAAVAQAEAGADIIAPSGMMDGAVAAVRGALDRRDFVNVGILAYAAKFASAFYGPFRDAADSAPQSGDRRSYQLDPPNLREALREVELDLAEGADMVMVKPGLPYLDVIAAVRRRTKAPLVAYNVSGEYAMVKAAQRVGWLASDGRVEMEILTAFKRAGADLVITYHAREVARRLRENND